MLRKGCGGVHNNNKKQIHLKKQTIVVIAYAIEMKFVVVLFLFFYLKQKLKGEVIIIERRKPHKFAFYGALDTKAVETYASRKKSHHEAKISLFKKQLV